MGGACLVVHARAVGHHDVALSHQGAKFRGVVPRDSRRADVDPFQLAGLRNGDGIRLAEGDIHRGELGIASRFGEDGGRGLFRENQLMPLGALSQHRQHIRGRGKVHKDSQLFHGVLSLISFQG